MLLLLELKFCITVYINILNMSSKCLLKLFSIKFMCLCWISKRYLKTFFNILSFFNYVKKLIYVFWTWLCYNHIFWVKSIFQYLFNFSKSRFLTFRNSIQIWQRQIYFDPKLRKLCKSSSATKLFFWCKSFYFRKQTLKALEQKSQKTKERIAQF